MSAGLDTAAVVLVATVRALKLHGGVRQGRSSTQPDPAAVERGLGNLEKHIESIRTFCEPPVVALNRFADRHRGGDRGRARAPASALGAPFAVSELFARGGEGGVELAEAVIEHAERRSQAVLPALRLVGAGQGEDGEDRPRDVRRAPR